MHASRGETSKPGPQHALKVQVCIRSVAPSSTVSVANGKFMQTLDVPTENVLHGSVAVGQDVWFVGAAGTILHGKY